MKRGYQEIESELRPEEDDGPTPHGPESVLHAAERRMASEIYGLIVASSVLAVGYSTDGIRGVAGSVLSTLIVYWLAESYAHIMAMRHIRGRRINWRHARHELRTGWPLVSASFIPLLAVIVAGSVGASVSNAQTVGLIAATVLLFISGWISSRNSDLHGIKRLLIALLAAAFGGALIILKAALH